MRLINTSTGKLEQFFDTQRPPYAILSHTWGKEELSYFDLLYLTSSFPPDAIGTVQALLRSPSRDSEAYSKLEACCRVAKSRGFEWVWIDTCCIDKSSSAELSEAINSMWAWYRDAAECYVYLSDVSPSSDVASAFSTLEDARWFTRGWTLQELLAPRNVIFYNSRWELIADRKQIGNDISQITSIPLVYLDGTYDPSDCKICSVAMKMSWLSSRQTTRTEDMAYCMFGLFDVHMPLIYGEGRKAFMRLQLEVLKKTDDDSIYAWAADETRSGLLATWPTAFANSGNIVQFTYPEDKMPWLPPVMTSLGLEFRSRYHRHDPHQQGIDLKHDVRSISTSIPTGDHVGLVMYCGPCPQNKDPITLKLTSMRFDNPTNWVIVILNRIGATWQRINCRKLGFTHYWVFDDEEMNAFQIYYVEQQGL